MIPAEPQAGVIRDRAWNYRRRHPTSRGANEGKSVTNPRREAVEAARVEQVSEIVAAIEEIILDKVGANILRSGMDGSFTSAGGKVARLIEEALEAAAPHVRADDSCSCGSCGL